MTDLSNRERAFILIDAANAADPNLERVDGRAVPKEILYSQRMSARLGSFVTQANDAVAIAARAQHICRWMKPRDDYPMTRAGYKQWRSELAVFHAEKTRAIVLAAGYDLAFCARVDGLLQKRGLKTNPETQLLEDVIGLVFLEHYFHRFSTTVDPEKLPRIIRRTWAKMSVAGRAAALTIDLQPAAKALILSALKSK